jgi:exodeoxyribonuclease-3
VAERESCIPRQSARQPFDLAEKGESRRRLPPQELKTEQHLFPGEALQSAGYEAVWIGERSWNGVAILSRNQEAVLTRSALPGDDHDDQARYIEAAIRGVLIGCIYLPNGNPQPGPKFTYKLKWFERLLLHSRNLMTAGMPVVPAGDYNVVPTPQDIYPTRSLMNNALVQPASREAFQRLLQQGWTDALRATASVRAALDFLGFKFGRWEADKGMRLDHFLLSSQLVPLLLDAGIDRWVRGEDNASDHAPVWITLDV